MGKRNTSTLKKRHRPAKGAKRHAAAPIRALLGPGQKILDFVILRHLGKGAFADVYLAQEVSLDRLVALKVSRDLGEEDRTLAGLEHDSIVKVYSSERIARKGILVINMQYIEGANLDGILKQMNAVPRAGDPTASGVLEVVRDLCQKNSFSPDVIAEREAFKSLAFEEAMLWIGEQIALALDFAHERDILHLDVKPANILLTAHGKPYLSDFNVSINTKQTLSTSLERIGGTIEYMAPEQQAVFTNPNPEELVGKVGRPADIYSLGKVLKEALQSVNISQGTKWVLERATAADPAARFQRAGELAQALRGCRQVIRIVRTFPAEDLISKTSQKRPLLALTLWGAIPQTFATLVAVFYNSKIAASSFTPEQAAVFRQLNLYFLPALQSLLTMVWVVALYKILPLLSSPDCFLSEPAKRKRAREELVKVPRWGLVVSTLGWLPCIVVYPAMIHLLGGPIPLTAAIQLGLCFFLSWLIASSYSYLVHQKIVCHNLYLRFVEGEADIHELAMKDLVKTLGYVKFFSLLTGFIPLFAAVISLLMGAEFSGAGVTLFKVMVCSLIGGGSAGLFVSIGLGQKLTTIVLALQRSGIRRGERD